MTLPVNVSEISFNHGLPRSYDHSTSFAFDMAFSSTIATPSLASKIETSHHPYAQSPSKGLDGLASLVDEIPAYMILNEPIPSQYLGMDDHRWWRLPAIYPRTRERESLPPLRTILEHALHLPIPISGPKRFMSPFAIAMEGANHRRPPFPGPLSLSNKPNQSQHNVITFQHGDISIWSVDSSPPSRFSGPADMEEHTLASSPASPLQEIETVPAPPEYYWRMSVVERYEELLSDVQIMEFDEHGAKCRLCEKVVRLGPTDKYTLGPWDRHKNNCRGSRTRRGRGFDVSAVLSDVAGVVEDDESVMKDLTGSDIMEAMGERYHLMNMNNLFNS